MSVKSKENKQFWGLFSATKSKHSPKMSRRESGNSKSIRVKQELGIPVIKSEVEFEEDKKVEIRTKKRKRIIIKNDDFDAFPVCGVEVRVPSGLKPYPSQKLIMVRVINAIKNQMNVLAESPTGSGKTMALLSSTCAWLRYYQEERRKTKLDCPVHGLGVVPKNELEEINEDVKDVKPAVKDVKLETETQMFENEWIEDFVPFGENVEKKFSVLDGVKIETEPKIECTCLPRARIYYGTRTHKQIAQVVKEFNRLPYKGILKHTILASREQSCINPAARKALDVSNYCKEINSSDGPGCSFKQAMRSRFEKSAPLRSHLENNGSVVFDTEELVETLATSSPQLCPYFSATRVLTQDADIIFCPFSYLVDPIIRHSSDVHVKNSVVILDEAHNIEDTCRDAASFTFTEKELEDSLISYKAKRCAADNELKSKPNNFNDESDKTEKIREYRTNLLILEHLLLEILRWVKKLASGARSSKNASDVLTATLDNEHLVSSLTDVEMGINLYMPLKTAKFNEIMASFNMVINRNDPEDQYFDIFKPSATAIVCVEKWMYFQSYFGSQQYQSTYRVNVTIEPIKQRYAGRVVSTAVNSFRRSAGPRNMQYADDDFSNDSVDYSNSWISEAGQTETDWIDADKPFSGHQPIAIGCQASVSLWCMSPALSFIDAFNECRSVILASGTLCPMETLKTELGVEFKQQAEGDQVISSEHIFAAVLPIGPFGNRLQCTYKSTSDASSPFYRELGAIITYVCKNIPAGILCFLPSYRVLDNLRANLEQSSNMAVIKSKKVVVYEPRRSSELGSVMAQYDEAIFEPNKCGPTINGALMFAVFRGKVSEGIDFADDRARVVISVGIPFPSSMDELVTAKRLYNDQNCKELGILSGEEWYVTQAYRALNQALGRCLRHRNDWGAMLMIDERLERQAGNRNSGGAASAKVSKWIRAQLNSYQSFQQFDEQFRLFFEKMSVKKEIL